MSRTDAASRVIRASAQKIYSAHLDPQAVAKWRPPQGMRAEIYNFDAREGGGYRMAFVYEDASVPGKTSAHADVFGGRFVDWCRESASSSASNSNPTTLRSPAL